MSTFENHSHILYILNLKLQVQRIINEKTTTYFFSFSNFKNLHQLIKSFVNPTTHRVYSQSKCHFVKTDLKNLKNLNNLKNLKINRLQTKQTVIHTRKLLCILLIRIVLFGIPLRRDEVSPPDVYNQNITRDAFTSA